jgi:hypothetical protein
MGMHPVSTSFSSVGELEFNLIKRPIFGVGRRVKAEIAGHLQHARVGRQHIPVQIAQTFCVCILNEVLHQLPANALALQIAPHDNGEFCAPIVRVRSQSHDAQQLLLILGQSDKGHGATIVDLREAGDEFVGELLLRGEKAEVNVFRRKPFDEGLIEMLVNRLDWPDEDAGTSGRLY